MMTQQHCILIGAPVDSGKKRPGCLMGPDAYQTAGLARTLHDLGHTVSDLGNITATPVAKVQTKYSAYQLEETIGWTQSLAMTAHNAIADAVPIFLGCDHALSLGSISGVNRYATAQGRPQFVLWLDAHSDFHTLETSTSGNLHGTPLAYLTGRNGFPGFPEMHAPIPQENVCMLGLRSIDRPELDALASSRIAHHDMREIDEHGIARPLSEFLTRVSAAGGMLHVSLDVDFLDPPVAPAVGTTVPGGATVREAHLVMEMLHDSGLMTSLDLVELNPFLDERGKTALLMVDLAASAFGRRVFDRPTRPFQ